MATVGSLVVNLATNNRPFNKGLKSARGGLTSFLGRITKGTAMLGGFAVGLAGVAGFAGFGILVKSSFSAIDQITKLADETGFGVKALVGLEHAAGLTGTSVETARKGVQIFVRRMGEATLGVGEGVKGFKLLGLSADELANKSPADAFLDVADAISNLDTPAERAAAAFSIFGRQGQEMMTLLSSGREGISAMTADAERLGLTFSRIEGSKVEAANDAILQMKSAVLGLARTTAISLAPVLTIMATQGTEFGVGMRATLQSLMPIVVQTGRVFISAFQTAFAFISEVFSLLLGTASVDMGSIRNLVMGALIMMEFGFQNWESIAELVFKKVALGFVSFGNDVVHLFTGVLPALFKFFGDNWRDVFFTAFDLATTVFINLGQNIRNAMTAIWEFITSGGKGGLNLADAWIPLEEGFVNTIKKLPDIPKRELGALEKELLKDVTQLGSKLENNLGDFVNKRRAEIQSLTKPIEEAQKPPEVQKPKSPDLGMSGSGKSELKGPRGLQKGSAEALKAILAFGQGQQTKPIDKVASNTKKTLEETKKQTGVLQQIVDSQPELKVASIG